LNRLDKEKLRKGLEPIARVKKLGFNRASRAAVALILNLNEAQGSLLLIRRADRDGDPWSGQIAFPGGRMTSQDSDLLDTVTRETREEVGINLLDHELLGTLNDVYSTRASLVITPFVASLRSNVALTIGKYEIAQAFWIPVNYLRMSPVIKHRIESFDGELEVDSISYRGHIIWGLTLRMIIDLASRLKDIDEPSQATKRF
jgi:8-oxo-dGTP pyrophosphatase MutT (NUDIX family)